VSEGLRRADGRFLAESEGSVDAFGHSQLGGVGPLIAATVKDRLGLKVHWTVPDYLQRSARHLASKTDLAHALAVGKAAVEYALKGMNGVMPIIERHSQQPYRWRVIPAPLSEIANQEKKMPPAFIRSDGYGISAAGRRYLQPLILGEAPTPYGTDGLPMHAEIRPRLARKRLPEWTP
jgi:6-phosphofructokinase 1